MESVYFKRYIFFYSKYLFFSYIFSASCANKFARFLERSKKNITFVIQRQDTNLRFDFRRCKSVKQGVKQEIYNFLKIRDLFNIGFSVS